MRNLMKERIRVAVDLISDALRGGFTSRSDFVQALEREYAKRGLKPLWGFSENSFEDELTFVYAVGKQVAAEELLKLEGIFAFELRADSALSAILSGRDARESVGASLGAVSAREVLAVARLAASYDLVEQRSEALPLVVRSLSAAFPELDETLLNFKRYYASLQLAALYASGSIDMPPPAILARSLAAALGDERAKPSSSLVDRIALEVFGVRTPAAYTAPMWVRAEIPLPLAQAGEKAEFWRVIYDQLTARLETAGRADAKPLAAVLVREAIIRGVDPATIDLSSVDAQRPLDAWRRYLGLDWQLNYVYLNIRGEFEVRLERRHDYAVLGRFSHGTVRSATREKLTELLYQYTIESGLKPADVSDEYLQVEIAQLVESIIQHAQQAHVPPPAKRAPLPLASRKLEVMGVPVELNLCRRRGRLYLEIRISSVQKIIIRVGRSVKSTLKRLKNALGKSLHPSVRGIALPLEDEIAKFLEEILSSSEQPQRNSAYNAR